MSNSIGDKVLEGEEGRSFVEKASMTMMSQFRYSSTLVRVKRDRKVDKHLTYLWNNINLADLYDELVFGERKSGTGEKHSPGHKDSSAENNALRVAVILLNQSSSNWCSSQTTESNEKGGHS